MNLGILFGSYYLSISHHVEGGEKYILKIIAHRNPDLINNTQGRVYLYVGNNIKLFTIYSFNHVSRFFMWVNNMCILHFSEYDSDI